MNENLEKIKKEVKVLVDKKKYKIALEIIENSNFHKNGTLLIISADCFYELGDDLNALGRYLKYLKIFPKGKARNFALFNSALCLENIGLYSEARDILELVEKNHPNLVSEIKHTELKLKRMETARTLLSNTWQEKIHNETGSDLGI